MGLHSSGRVVSSSARSPVQLAVRESTLIASTSEGQIIISVALAERLIGL